MTRLSRRSEPSRARSAPVTEALEGRTLFSATSVAAAEAPAPVTSKMLEACSTGRHFHNPQTFQIISAGSNGPL